MKMHAIFRLTVSALAIVLAVGFLQPARTTASTSLTIPPIAQRFSPPINGDAGIYDCLPATVTMALGYVVQQHGLSLNVGYQTVRAAFRAAVGGATGKLSPLLTKSTVEALTGGAISGDAAMLPKSGWETWVASELQAGLPPIAVVPDWRALPGEANEQWKAVHAVLITSLSDTSVGFNDPWAGQAFSMSVAAFEAAWAQGDQVEAAWLVVGSARASPTPPVTGPSPPSGVSAALVGHVFDDCFQGGTSDTCPARVRVRWRDTADNEDGFRIYAQLNWYKVVAETACKKDPLKEGHDQPELVAAAASDETTWIDDIAIPVSEQANGRTYFGLTLLVASYNANSESDLVAGPRHASEIGLFDPPVFPGCGPRDLGVLDVNAGCEVKYGAGSFAFPAIDNTASGWVCFTSNGSSPIGWSDVDRWCQKQYGERRAYAEYVEGSSSIFEYWHCSIDV